MSKKKLMFGYSRVTDSTQWHAVSVWLVISAIWLFLNEPSFAKAVPRMCKNVVWAWPAIEGFVVKYMLETTKAAYKIALTGPSNY